MEESEFLEQRMEREKRYQKKIEDLRTQDADDYNKSKKKVWKAGKKPPEEPSESTPGTIN